MVSVWECGVCIRGESMCELVWTEDNNNTLRMNELACWLTTQHTSSL